MSVVLSKFFKSKWSEEQINSKLDEALDILSKHKDLDDLKINKLRSEAKKLIKL